MREPVVTPWEPSLGATAATLGMGTTVVVVVAALVVVDLGKMALGLVVRVVGAAAVAGVALVATGRAAGVRGPRASRLLGAAADLVGTSPPVATRARSAVTARAAR